MANDEHVKWLLEGVGAWNQRRQTDYFQARFVPLKRAGEVRGSRATWP